MTDKNSRGFSLLEVIVGMGIFVLLITGIVSLFLWGNYGKNVVWEQLSTQNEGRKVVQDFVRDLRRANFSNIGAYPIESAGDTQIIFYSNIDADSWRERVRYFLAGNILKRGVIKPGGNPLAYNPASEVVTDVVHDVTTSTIFYYYGDSYVDGGSALSAPVDVTKIRVVEIKLNLEENPRLSPTPFNIEAKVDIRNLKAN